MHSEMISSSIHKLTDKKRDLDSSVNFDIVGVAR